MRSAGGKVRGPREGEEGNASGDIDPSMYVLAPMGRNGGRGADDLRGGAGDDSLTGGQGNDYLSGGGGADIFVLNATAGFDTIDGGRGSWIDTIDLAGVDDRRQASAGNYRYLQLHGSK